MPPWPGPPPGCRERAEVAGKSRDVTIGRGPDLGHGPVHSGLSPTIDNDPRTFPCETGGDRQPNSGCAAAVRPVVTRSPHWPLRAALLAPQCERSRRLQVDDELEPGRLHDR
jgi:hypothetical protein